MVAKLIQRNALALALTLCGLAGFAQTPLTQAVKQSSYTFESSEGTNASAVVWIAPHNLFITAIAGNADFPLEGFRSTGSSVFSEVSGLDLRGVWYDAKKDRLYANAAGEEGWFSIQLGEKGKPEGDWKSVCEGSHQPDFQSVLAGMGKLVVGYADNYFYFYDAKNGKFKKEVELTGYSSASLNSTTVGVTENAKFPLALLDAAEGRIVFFNLKGESIGSTNLPEGAASPDMFRFSFAKGLAWLYDEENRTWTAYKVFE
jgi:hypothetical protein